MAGTHNHPPPMSSSPELDQILASAIAIARAAPSRDVEPLGLLYEARHHGREALDRGLALLRRSDAVERAVGCDLLAELCSPDDHGWGPEVAVALVAMAQAEDDPDVLRPLVRAIGRAGHPSGLPLLDRLSSHPDPDIRCHVATAVYFCDDNGDAENVQRILIGLMSDEDDDVRDWATFGLGTQTHLDGADVRDALLRSTGDPDEETRDEAILGIARRRDHRALDVVAGRLGEGDVSNIAVEAACYMADERLLPVLRGLETWWDLDERLVANAVAACDPEQQRRRGEVQERLLDELTAALAARPGTIRCALYCERLELGVGLRLEQGAVEPTIYDVDALVKVRGGGDVASAVRAVLSDLDTGP
jgi:HEAT repeat protein